MNLISRIIENYKSSSEVMEELAIAIERGLEPEKYITSKHAKPMIQRFQDSTKEHGKLEFLVSVPLITLELILFHPKAYIKIFEKYF